MYPRQIDRAEVDRLYTWLASSGGCAGDLLKHWQAVLAELETKLDRSAQAALFDATAKSDALVLYGRAAQLRDMISFVQQKSRSEK